VHGAIDMAEQCNHKSGGGVYVLIYSPRSHWRVCHRSILILVADARRREKGSAIPLKAGISRSVFFDQPEWVVQAALPMWSTLVKSQAASRRSSSSSTPTDLGSSLPIKNWKWQFFRATSSPGCRKGIASSELWSSSSTSTCAAPFNLRDRLRYVGSQQRRELPAGSSPGGECEPAPEPSDRRKPRRLHDPRHAQGSPGCRRSHGCHRGRERASR